MRLAGLQQFKIEVRPLAGKKDEKSLEKISRKTRFFEVDAEWDRSKITLFVEFSKISTEQMKSLVSSAFPSRFNVSVELWEDKNYHCKWSEDRCEVSGMGIRKVDDDLWFFITIGTVGEI